MMPIRNVGSRGFATPGSFSIGFRAGPMPPVKLAPWQLVQLAAKSAAPAAGSPGSVGLPEGDGELAAIVLIAVSANSAGTAATTSVRRVIRLGNRMARQIIACRYFGPQAGIGGKRVGFIADMASCSPVSRWAFCCVSRRWLDARSAYRG